MPHAPPERIVKTSAYPIKGLLFFLKTKRLWFWVSIWSLIGIIVSIALSVILFLYAYPGQWKWMNGALPEGLSKFLAIILTIFECIAVSLLWTIIYSDVFVFDQLFKEVLRIKGYQILASGVTIHKRHAHKIFMFFAKKAIFKSAVPMIHGILAIAFLPVNVVPILGWILYFSLNGYLIGYEAHLTYFDLKGLKFSEAREYVQKHKSQYFAFGAAAAALQMIPILGIFFGFTNVIGAALWASNLEKHGDGPVSSKPLVEAPNAEGDAGSSGSLGSNGHGNEEQVETIVKVNSHTELTSAASSGTVTYGAGKK